MPKASQWPYGSLVDKATHRLRWMAPTTLQKGDPNDGHGGGCLRKIHYRYVIGLKQEEESPWLGLGIQCHGEIENHLISGQPTLGPISGAVKPYLPAPDPERIRLLVEHDIGGGSLAKATFGVDVNGSLVPFVGYTDVVRANAVISFGDGFLDSSGQAITEDGNGTYDDPPGTIECLDWKFGGAKKGSQNDYSLNAADLASDTQMVTIGAWAIHRTPETTAPVRLSHVYTNTKGRAESSKASILIPRENLLKRWEYIKAATRTIADVVKERDPERVPGNKAACQSFGGCPYAGKPCQIPIEGSLETFFGGDVTMSILDTLNLPTPPATVSATPTGVAASLGLDIGSQMAALASAQAPTVPPEFEQAVDAINAKGYGMVPLGGEAAKLYAALMVKRNPGGGYTLDAQGFAGTGELAKTTLTTDPARLVAISREMAPLPPKTPVQQTPPAAPPVSTAPMGILSPETPPSDPAKASVPVEGFAHPAAVTPNVQVPGLMASVPPAQAAQVVANTVTAAPATNVAAEVEKPKKTRTKKPKTEGAAPETSDDARWLFVDCIPNVEYVDCAKYVTEWAQGMAKHFKLAPPYDDIRMAGNDSPIGYGKGLAALESVAKNVASSLPPGAYYISTEGELGRAVAFGLASARTKNADGTDGEPVFELVVRKSR